MDIPNFGIQQLDTASPLMALAKSRMENQQMAVSNIDLQSKKNMLAMQTISAAAAGGQESYDKAKQLLQANGIDVSGWAADATTGAAQAKALQTALIPPVAMMNAGIQQQKADAETAAGLGVKPPVPANSALYTKSPASLPQESVSALNPGMTLPGAQTSALPQDTAQPRQLSPQEQQGLQQAQQQYQGASPADQKQTQDVVNGAATLQGLQSDPNAVQKFLDDPNNMHSQENIEMRKLWSSDTSPNKQQFWQKNATHLALGQAVGITPQPSGAAQTQTINPDYPNPPQPNENPKARTDRQAGNLAIQKAQLENDPTHVGGMKTAEKSGESKGEEIGAINKALNVAWSNAPAILERINTIKQYAPDASSGMGVTADGSGPYPSMANSALGKIIEPKTATANMKVNQAAAQNAFPEIVNALSNANMKGNRFLENIQNQALSLNMAAPSDTKIYAADGNALMFIKQLKAMAEHARALGQPAPSDNEIDQMVIQSGYKPSASEPPVNTAPASGGWSYGGKVQK